MPIVLSKEYFTSLDDYKDIGLEEISKRAKFVKENQEFCNKVFEILAEKVKELDIARRKYYLLSDIIIKNTNSPIDTCKNFIKKFAYFHEKTNTNKN